MRSVHGSNSFRQGRAFCRTEDEDVSAAVAAAFRESGIVVRENFGDDRVLREDAERRADDLLERRRTQTALRRRSR